MVIYLCSHVSSCSCFSVCRCVVWQPLLAYLQGKLTVLATFSIAKFRIFPEKLWHGIMTLYLISKKCINALNFSFSNPHTYVHVISYKFSQYQASSLGDVLWSNCWRCTYQHRHRMITIKTRNIWNLIYSKKIYASLKNGEKITFF